MTFSLILYILKIIAQVAIISYAIYKLYNYFHQSRAMTLFYLFFYYGTFLLIFNFLGFDVLENIMHKMFIPFFVAVLLIYQSDVRRSIPSSSSSSKFMRKRENFISSYCLDQILSAVYSLADIKRGALLVIKKNDKLENYISKGTKLGCDISSAILLTIFDHDTPLHDGAVIIDRDTIVAAGCYLPLTEQVNIKKTYGTRHRAAIGATEETDAIVIVVSEETKMVSVCYNSNIYPDLAMTDAKHLLIQLMGLAKEGRKE